MAWPDPVAGSDTGSQLSSDNSEAGDNDINGSHNKVRSGSDLTAIMDKETGRLSADWDDEEDFDNDMDKVDNENASDEEDVLKSYLDDETYWSDSSN